MVLSEQKHSDHTGSTSMTTTKSSKQAIPWKAYLCFLMMNLCQRVLIVYYQGIADKALGCHKCNIAVIMLCQFISQCVIGATIPYWSFTFSHSTRMLTTSILFAVSIIGLAICYGQSTDIKERGLLYFSRICILICVVINSVASMVAEITLLQYLTFYHEACAKGLSLGVGIGAIIGALWSLTIQSFYAPWISIVCCLLFPVILVVTFFKILPPRNDQERELPSRSRHSQESDVETKAEDIQKMGIYATTKTILFDFTRYSVPLVLVDILYEIIRSGFLVHIFPSNSGDNFYGMFNFIFQLAYCGGALFTNFYSSSNYQIVLGIELFVLFALSIPYYYANSNAPFVMFIRETVSGRGTVLFGLGIPLGYSYGSIIANSYYTIRRKIHDEKLRSFLLGNMRQMFTYGQIIGSLIALWMHWVYSGDTCAQVSPECAYI